MPVQMERRPVELSKSDAAMLMTRAVAVAVECGLRHPIIANQPEVIMYPRYGHGYRVNVYEDAGARRSGCARFNEKFESTYWTIDGKNAV